MAQVIEYLMDEPPTNELAMEHAIQAIHAGELFELSLLPVAEVPRPLPVKMQMRISDTHHDQNEGHRFKGSNHDSDRIYIDTSVNGTQPAYAWIVAR